MNPEGTDLLSQLRDIHGAPEAPWWPPAPGWWILGLLLAVALFLLIRHLRQRFYAHKRKLQLINFIERVESGVDPQAEPQEFLSRLNRIFKIVALRAFPESHCALMQGREWTDFIQVKLGEQGAANELSALAAGPYQPQSSFDAGTLSGLAKQWIRRYG